MAACWIVLALAVFMSSDKGDAFNQNQLTKIVKDLKTNYQVNGMFSMAVNIPSDSRRQPDLTAVFRDDPPADVQRVINSGGIYTGRRIVAAKPNTATRPPQHAEYRVLSNLNRLTSTERDRIVVYTYASPCNDYCTNAQRPQSNILQHVTALKEWTDYAFTFTKVFKPNNQDAAICDETLRNSLMCLANSGSFGLANIFRCDRAGTFTCSSCSAGGQVADRCVNNNN